MIFKYFTAPSFKICQKSSPNLASCVTNSIEYLRPNLKAGDLGNGFKTPSIDPLLIDDIKLERGRGFFFHLNNLKVYKLTNFKVDKLRVNPDTFHIDVLLKIPNVDASSDYKINLLLGLVAIQGQGKVTGTIETVKVRLTVDTESFFKNGIEYKRVKNLRTLVKLENLVLRINDLFKDPVLNQVGEQLVNQNLPMFLPEIEKSVQKSVGK